MRRFLGWCSLGLLLVFCTGAATSLMKIVKSRVAAVGGGACNLLDEPFENTDGVELVSHTWTADGTTCPTNTCEIDTARFQAGSSSAVLKHSTFASTYRLYKAITEQTSGTFYLDMHIQFDTVPDAGNEEFIVLTDGAYSSGVTTLVTLRRFGTSVQARNGSGGYDTVCASCVAADTWYRIELEINVTAQTYSAWFDTATQMVTNAPLAKTGNPDRVYLQKRQSVDASESSWIDTLCVQSGGRPA